MASIREINVGGTLHDVKSTHYATCDTAAATAAKVATIQNGAFTLETGVKVSVNAGVPFPCSIIISFSSLILAISFFKACTRPFTSFTQYSISRGVRNVCGVRNLE